MQLTVTPSCASDIINAVHNGLGRPLCTVVSDIIETKYFAEIRWNKEQCEKVQFIIKFL